MSDTDSGGRPKVWHGIVHWRSPPVRADATQQLAHIASHSACNRPARTIDVVLRVLALAQCRDEHGSSTYTPNASTLQKCEARLPATAVVFKYRSPLLFFIKLTVHRQLGSDAAAGVYARAWTSTTAPGSASAAWLRVLVAVKLVLLQPAELCALQQLPVGCSASIMPCALRAASRSLARSCCG